MENRENFICTKCKHFRLITGGCDAFPDGIIDEVLLTNIHNDVYPQQSNEILFEEGEPKFE